MHRVKIILILAYILTQGLKLFAQVPITGKIFASNAQIFENKPTTVKQLFIIQDAETFSFANNVQHLAIENSHNANNKCIPPMGYEPIRLGTSQTKEMNVCFYTELRLYNQMMQEQSMTSAISFDLTITGNKRNGFKVHSYKVHEEIPKHHGNSNIAIITTDNSITERSTVKPISDERSRQQPLPPLRRQ